MLLVVPFVSLTLETERRVAAAGLRVERLAGPSLEQTNDMVGKVDVVIVAAEYVAKRDKYLMRTKGWWRRALARGSSSMKLTSFGCAGTFAKRWRTCRTAFFRWMPGKHPTDADVDGYGAARPGL
jgi:hypothetical protein